MKLILAVLLMGGIAWGQKPACTKDNIGQLYTDKRKQDNWYPLWLCTPDGWMNVHPGGIPKEHVSLGEPEPPATIQDPQPKPLKCGKYQHIEQDRVVRDHNSHGAVDGFRIESTPQCVDTPHTVTEKEWQELQQRLKKLEEKPHATTYPMLPPRP